MSTSCAGVDQRAPYHHLRSSGAAETSLAGHGPSVGSLDHSTVALAFSAVLALQNRGPVAPHPPPDQSQIGTTSRPDSIGALGLDACLPTRHCLPSACLSPFRNRHLVSKLSDSDLAVPNSIPSRLTRLLLDPARRWHFYRCFFVATPSLLLQHPGLLRTRATAPP